MTPDPLFTVGTLVELTRDEQRQMFELAARMHSAANHRHTGWLAEYTRALTEASRLIRNAVGRSHAS